MKRIIGLATILALFFCLTILAAPTDAPKAGAELEARNGAALEAARGESPKEAHSDAVEVYACDFGETSDINFDNWPDNWSRRRGRKFPSYLKVEMIKDDPIKNDCLRMELDGGAATAYSPPIEVSPLFSYVLKGAIKTEQLKHDIAYISVNFFDSQQKLLERYKSPIYGHPSKHLDATEWTDIKIGPVTPHNKEIRAAVIGLHLTPEKQADLTGAARFSDIWFARLPRMVLSSNSKHNVYTGQKQITITCEVSGILERDPLITFELIDIGSQKLARMENRLNGEVVALKKLRASAFSGKHIARAKIGHDGYAGKMSWTLPVKDNGFYRVNVAMLGHEVDGKPTLLHKRSISLAVVEPGGTPPGGEFGWTLPQGDQPLSFSSLGELLADVGISWCKFPVWFSAKEDSSRADQIARFAEDLGAHGIEMIGMLDEPPADLREQFGVTKGHLDAANVFVQPELWQGALEPVMTRLSLKVRWWQLGRDGDISFVRYENLAPKIKEVKKHLERFGQEIHLGIGWRWMAESPRGQNPPWKFLSFSEEPPFTQNELRNYLAATKVTDAQRWVVLKPLHKDKYSVEERARDLVGRMLAAKMEHADAVFIPAPFDANHGLMNPDGTPGELLLPWRTTALLISGSDYVGSIRMPNGSRNYIFSRGNEAVMVVWNEVPVEETIFLGDEAYVVDLWGRRREAKYSGNRQVIPSGPMPMFIRNVNRDLARLRMSFNFENQKLAGVFGRKQTSKFSLENTFSQGVGGHVTIQTPKVWEIFPKKKTIKLALGEKGEFDFQILLRPDASSGIHPIRVDFDITADNSYDFSIYRELEVGLGDVTMEFSTHLNDNGELEIRQVLENKTESFVSFKCMLFAPGRRRIRKQIQNLSQGRDTKIYVMPKGEDLIGKTLRVRAEEIGGERILNYRVVAER